MRAVDWALVNTETMDVLRTATNEHVLSAICDHMRSHTISLGGNPDRYRVMEMRRAEMGDALYERAIDIRWQQYQRRISQRARDIGHLPISAMR
jgi:hypothetical protein